MAVQIIIDSASDILPDEAAEMGLIHIPLTVTFDGIEYKDGVDLSHREFFEKLIESADLPTTSQINPATYSSIISKVLSDGDTPLIIALSSELSGTYQSAMIASYEADGEVYVVDSLNVALGARILINLAVKLRDEGKSASEIVDILNVEKKNIRLIALLDTLEYLKKGGRISAATAFAGGVLSIKPVIEVQDGKVVLIGKARGSKNANNLLREMVRQSRGIDFSKPVCLAYTGLSDEYVKKYIDDSQDLWKGHTDELPIVTVGASIGTHVGPGAIAVSYFEQ